jgi:hypothetical protein
MCQTRKTEVIAVPDFLAVIGTYPRQLLIVIHSPREQQVILGA